MRKPSIYQRFRMELPRPKTDGSSALLLCTTAGSPALIQVIGFSRMTLLGRPGLVACRLDTPVAPLRAASIRLFCSCCCDGDQEPDGVQPAV